MEDEKPREPQISYPSSLRLRELATEAEAARTTSDVQAVNNVLARLAGIDDHEFEALGLDDLKLVIEAASSLGEIGDTRLISDLLARSINAMSKFEVLASDFILPLYNLRATYLVLGAREEADGLLGHIVEAARHAGTVSDSTVGALNELVTGFENAGYLEAAAILYRPIHDTILAIPAFDWRAKIKVTARLGHLLLANGQATAAVGVYQRTLERLGDTDAGADAAYARMILWGMAAEAYARAGAYDDAGSAYATAVSAAEASGDPDGLEASTIYYNQAGFWLAHGMRDHYPEAIALTRRLLTTLEKLDATETSEYAACLGQLANLHGKLEDTTAAQRYFDDCFVAFAAAGDADPADIADYREDEGRLRLESAQAGQAIASFSIALELRNAIAGFPADRLADTCGWLGVARFEHGDCARASEAFRDAIRRRLEQPDINAQPGEPR